MALPLLEENQIEVHTQGLSKPYHADYTATAGKCKTNEPGRFVLVIGPVQDSYKP
jgi:hypothetical protein